MPWPGRSTEDGVHTPTRRPHDSGGDSGRKTPAGQIQTVIKRHSLIDKVYAPANLAAAFHHGAHRDGAPGPDGISWSDYRFALEFRLRNLGAHLRDGHYEIKQPRARTIRTKAGGTLVVYIWNIEDRIVQQAVARALLRALRGIFHSVAFGFSRGRCLTAAKKKLVEASQNFDSPYFFSLDIANCFPAMDAGRVLRCFSRYVSDGKVLSLVKSAVLSAQSGGLPPGSPLSGVLADLFLRDFDAFLDSARMIRYCDNVLGFAATHEAATADVKVITGHLGNLSLLSSVSRTRIVPTSNPALLVFDDGTPIMY